MIHPTFSVGDKVRTCSTGMVGTVVSEGGGHIVYIEYASGRVAPVRVEALERVAVAETTPSAWESQRLAARPGERDTESPTQESGDG